MQDMPIDKLLEKTGSLFKLVIVASRRALELTENPSAKLVDVVGEMKPQGVALKEILEGKISFKVQEGA